MKILVKGWSNQDHILYQIYLLICNANLPVHIDPMIPTGTLRSRLLAHSYILIAVTFLIRKHDLQFFNHKTPSFQIQLGFINNERNSSFLECINRKISNLLVPLQFGSLAVGISPPSFIRCSTVFLFHFLRDEFDDGLCKCPVASLLRKTFALQ